MRNFHRENPKEGQIQHRHEHVNPLDKYSSDSEEKGKTYAEVDSSCLEVIQSSLPLLLHFCFQKTSSRTFWVTKLSQKCSLIHLSYVYSITRRDTESLRTSLIKYTSPGIFGKADHRVSGLLPWGQSPIKLTFASEPRDPGKNKMLSSAEPRLFRESDAESLMVSEKDKEMDSKSVTFAVLLINVNYIQKRPITVVLCQ